MLISRFRKSLWFWVKWLGLPASDAVYLGVSWGLECETLRGWPFWVGLDPGPSDGVRPRAEAGAGRCA